MADDVKPHPAQAAVDKFKAERSSGSNPELDRALRTIAALPVAAFPSGARIRLDDLTDDEIAREYHYRMWKKHGGG